jgi:hypothetical protein
MSFGIGLPKWSLAYSFAAITLISLGWFLGITSQRREVSSTRELTSRLEGQLRRERAIRVAAESRATSDVVPSFGLISDDHFTRGATALKSPVVIFAPGQSFVYLEMSLDDAHFTYRATIKSFVGESEILSENQLQPELAAPGAKVRVMLPAALIKSGEDYTLNLRAADRATNKSNSTFTFHVVKQ